MNDQLMNVFREMTATAKAAILVAGFALLVACFNSVGVLSAMMRPALSELMVTGDDDPVRLAFETALDGDRKFIDGKSIFYPPNRMVVVPEDDEDEPVAPVFETYRGPKLMGLSGHFAYFDREVLKGGKEIRVGEKGGTLELVRIIPPFQAVVRWQSKEWPLNLLETTSTYGAGEFGGGATNASRMGVANSGAGNPFSQRGSSPNGSALFSESQRQDGSSGGSRGGPAPGRRPTRSTGVDN